MDPESIIDFSSNLNDFVNIDDTGNIQANKFLRMYPEDQPDWLLEKLSRYSHADRNEILLGSGLTHFIHLLCDLYENSRMLLVSPSFMEYERTCRSKHTSYSTLPGRILADNPYILKRYNPGLIVITRPDNPTGSMIRFSSLLEILSVAEDVGSNVFIDEAFIDFTDVSEFVGAVQLVHEYGNLILGRSLTKILAMPSLRIGYLISGSANLDPFRKLMEPWAIGQDHMEVLRNVDLENVRQSAANVKENREYLISSMREIGMAPVGDPQANYVTFRLMDNVYADQLLESLQSSGLVIRSLWNYPDFGKEYVRIAVKSREKTDLLVNGIRRMILH
ncbi:MAG: aminotransferase class I/II-fold pyridoxal phosphate-dependent enzyme [Thermoplasmata archaeon]